MAKKKDKKQDKKFVINMNEMNLKKIHFVPSFKSGPHKTEKDKPRDKNWRKWSE